MLGSALAQNLALPGVQLQMRLHLTRTLAMPQLHARGPGCALLATAQYCSVGPRAMAYSTPSSKQFAQAHRQQAGLPAARSAELRRYTSSMACMGVMLAATLLCAAYYAAVSSEQGVIPASLVPVCSGPV